MQINELRNSLKNVELDVADHKRKEDELESKLKQMKQLFETVRGERNILSKNMLMAKVSCAAVLLIKQ